MPTTGKRQLLGRGTGHFNSAGSQYRFIVFLIVVLGAYTFLLKVFQKLAAIVQLPLFLPIGLITILVFVGMAGTMYSHTFVGPMQRIRRIVEHLAEGDTNVCLRLRGSDDPVLKELGTAVSQLCEHSRNSQMLIRDAAEDLFAAIEALREKVRQGADQEEILKLVEGLRATQELLEKAVATGEKR
jgi:methyl-accepting chemotaxis protein